MASIWRSQIVTNNTIQNFSSIFQKLYFINWTSKVKRNQQRKKYNYHLVDSVVWFFFPSDNYCFPFVNRQPLFPRFSHRFTVFIFLPGSESYLCLFRQRSCFISPQTKDLCFISPQSTALSCFFPVTNISKFPQTTTVFVFPRRTVYFNFIRQGCFLFQIRQLQLIVPTKSLFSIFVSLRLFLMMKTSVFFIPCKITAFYHFIMAYYLFYSSRKIINYICCRRADAFWSCPDFISPLTTAVDDFSPNDSCFLFPVCLGFLSKRRLHFSSQTMLFFISTAVLFYTISHNGWFYFSSASPVSCILPEICLFFNPLQITTIFVPQQTSFFYIFLDIDYFFPPWKINWFLSLTRQLG